MILTVFGLAYDEIAMDVQLPEPWILQRYLTMLHRGLRAARAYARGTHPHVIEQITVGIQLERPDPFSDSDETVAGYLKTLEKLIVGLRYQCGSLYDPDGHPFDLIVDEQTSCLQARYPACEPTSELLDALHNFPELLTHWNESSWCPPRVLYDWLQYYEMYYEGGKARFSGYLTPIDEVAPLDWKSCQQKAGRS